jgi:hypothetical protein
MLRTHQGARCFTPRCPRCPSMSLDVLDVNHSTLDVPHPRDPSMSARRPTQVPRSKRRDAHAPDCSPCPALPRNSAGTLGNEANDSTARLASWRPLHDCWYTQQQELSCCNGVVRMRQARFDGLTCVGRARLRMVGLLYAIGHKQLKGRHLPARRTSGQWFVQHCCP